MHFHSQLRQDGGVICIKIGGQIHTLHSIANSNFSSNNATVNGGAILLIMHISFNLISWSRESHSVYINNCIFDSNLAENGGAFYLNKVNNLTFSNYSLSNNIRHHTSNISNGGAVAIIIQDISSVIRI